MNDSKNTKRLRETRSYWDQAAAQFDDEPDHGLRDPAVREAWTHLLQTTLPSKPGTVLDIGCGTGSLSVVLAGLGYQVTGIDLSPEMISIAQAKTARLGLRAKFQVMDATFPRFPQKQFDALVCRHLLWALPEPAEVLQRWAELLLPGGYQLLIEGFWHTGAGLHANEVLNALPASMTLVSVLNLSNQPALWGGAVEDERYAILTRRSPHLAAP